jgi:hypothetical protein
MLSGALIRSFIAQFGISEVFEDSKIVVPPK